MTTEDDEIPPGTESRALNAIEDTEVGVGEVNRFREFHGDEFQASFDGGDSLPLLDEVIHELLDETFLSVGVGGAREGGIEGENEGTIKTSAAQSDGDGRLTLIGDGSSAPLTEGKVSAEIQFVEVGHVSGIGDEEFRLESGVDGGDDFCLGFGSIGDNTLEVGFDESGEGGVLLDIPGTSREKQVKEFAIAAFGGGNDEFKRGLEIPFGGDTGEGGDGSPGGDVHVLNLGVNVVVIDGKLVESGCNEVELGLGGCDGGIVDDVGFNALNPARVDGRLTRGEGGLGGEVGQTLDQSALGSTGGCRQKGVHRVLADIVSTKIGIKDSS